MTKNTNLTFLVSLIAAIGLPVAGFGVAGLWGGEFILLALILFGWIGHHGNWAGITTLIFVLYVAIAAGGLWLGASPILMIAGVTASLGCWELVERSEKLSAPSDLPAHRRYARQRLVLLGTTIVLSIAIVGIAGWIKIRAGFGIIYLTTAIVAFSLFRQFRLFMKLPRS